MNIRRIAARLLALVLVLTASAGAAEQKVNVPYQRFMIHKLLKNSTFIDLEDAEALAPYYRMAQERKEAILHSPTLIVKADTFIPGETYTGTAYYVSETGSDQSDGLSPETAWQTFDHLRDRELLQPGDAVFFERGGTYRLAGAPLHLCDQVTYSAYGEGEKPVITFVPEDSAREECWTLWYEGENGEKIWRYDQDVGDVGGVVLNDEIYARRILEWPTPYGWLALDITTRDIERCIAENTPDYYEMKNANEYRTVEQQLTEDLTYVSRISLDHFKVYPFDYSNGLRVGDLFLRCDQGNPGTVYDEIAVIAMQPGDEGWGPALGNLMDGMHADGWVLDNLSLKYFLENSVFSANNAANYAVIQNCTQEWGGNTLFKIERGIPQYDYSLIGDGIYCVSRNVTIRNNYFRQCSNASGFENSMEKLEPLGTYRVEGNLIENCGQGIRASLIKDRDEEKFDHILIKDNIIIGTGDSMNNANWEQPVAIDFGTHAVQFAKHIEACDNVLIGSATAIFRIPDTKEVVCDIHDNVIAQSRDGALITEFQWFRSDELIWHMMEYAQ